MTPNTIARKFTLDVGWVFVGQLTAMLIALGLRVVLGRYLGADNLGLFALSFTIHLMAGIIGSLGVPQALVKFAAEFNDDIPRLSSFVSAALITSLLFGTSIGAILYFLAGPIADLFDMPDLEELIRIVALSIPFVALNNTLLLGLFTGLRQMKYYGIGMTFRALLLIGIALMLLAMGQGVRGAVLAIPLAEIGTFLLAVIMARKHLRFSIPGFLPTARTLISFGAKLFFAGIIYMVNTRLDMFLIGYFLVESDVGFYSIAVAVATGFRLLPGVVSTVTYPMMSEYHAKQKHMANETLINTTMKNALIGLSVIGIIIILLSNDFLVWILGSDFSASIAPLTVLVIGIIFYGSMGSVGSVFSAIGRPDIPFILNLVVLVVNIGLDIVLIPRIGIVGAAIGTAVSLAVLTVLIVWFLHRIQGIGISVTTYLYVMLPVFAFTAAFFILRDQLIVYVVGGLMFVAYLGFTYSVTMNYNDKLAIRDLVASIVGQRKTGK